MDQALKHPETCRNPQCQKALAMAREMAIQHRLDPESLLPEIVAQEIAPVLHCRKSDSPNACPYGYLPDEQTLGTREEHLNGTWKVYICEKQKSSCQECMEHAGEMYLWPEEAHLMPKLPLHPNCRCYYLTLGNDSFQARRMKISK